MHRIIDISKVSSITVHFNAFQFAKKAVKFQKVSEVNTNYSICMTLLISMIALLLINFSLQRIMFQIFISGKLVLITL